MFLFEIGHTINMHHEHLGDNTYIEIFANYQFFSLQFGSYENHSLALI